MGVDQSQFIIINSSFDIVHKLLFCQFDNFSVSYDFLFILPDKHKGEWNKEETKDERPESIASF
jgi:hypothetical protein